MLKPRLENEYIPGSGFTTLNEYYPDNKNIFFYIGTRAENKFYHFASGHPKSDSGYTRVTSALTLCESCLCGLLDTTEIELCNGSDIPIDFNCTTIYPLSGFTLGPLECYKENTTECGCEDKIIPDEDA